MHSLSVFILYTESHQMKFMVSSGIFQRLGHPMPGILKPETPILLLLFLIPASVIFTRTLGALMHRWIFPLMLMATCGSTGLKKMEPPVLTTTAMGRWMTGSVGILWEE